jgi:hypothetical protein
MIRGPEKEVRCETCGKSWVTRGWGLSATLRGMIRTNQGWAYPNVCEQCVNNPKVDFTRKIVSINPHIPQFD